MQYCFETYNRASLYMYNGLSQVDCINWKEESISIQRIKQSVNFSGAKPRTPLFFLICFLKALHHTMTYSTNVCRCMKNSASTLVYAEYVRNKF